MSTMTIWARTSAARNPEDMKELAEKYHTELVEHVAELDDDLMDKYLSGEEITINEIKDCIRKSTIANHMVPVTCGTSYKNKGVQKLLDAIVDYMPAPTTFLPSRVPTPTPVRKRFAILPTRSPSPLWRLRLLPTPSWASCASSACTPAPSRPALRCTTL